ncbi:MAG: PdxA family protein [Bdellovibrionales bacterium]
MKLFALTSGDPNGVGLEVTAKALEMLGPQSGSQFVLFRSSSSEIRQLKRLDSKFKRVTVGSFEEGLRFFRQSPNSKVLLDLEHPKSAPFWVEEAATLCHEGILKGLITAPLSKTLIQKAGFKAKGHTEILQKVTGTSKVHMVFVGEHFSVLLATGHIPLAKVSKALTAKELKVAVQSALNLRKILPSHKRRKPVAILGLNPHAGEGGILGQEEQRIFQGALKGLSPVVGPLSPDAAFSKGNWDRFSVFVACYHDQGLIPFKMIHGTQSGYHLTFGLPFIRTSVDHGTAFDIYGQNKADGHSMRDAIQACLELSR